MAQQTPDHFKQTTQGDAYAGDHLLVEFWGARDLGNMDILRDALESSAIAAGATLLHSHYHRFGNGGGISGVALLAESHITIHTWPERRFAAIDIFMCGNCDPSDCLPTLMHVLCPEEIKTRTFRRGDSNTNGRIQKVA